MICCVDKTLPNPTFFFFSLYTNIEICLFLELFAFVILEIADKTDFKPLRDFLTRIKKKLDETTRGALKAREDKR